MSDPVLIAIVAAITALAGGLPATIAAYAALVQGRKNADKQVATDEKTAELVKTTAEIHTLANSAKDKLTSALDVANEKIIGMEKQIALPVDAKQLAAVAVALATPAKGD